MKSLRDAMRRRRAALEPGEIASLSARIARHLWRLPVLARGRRVACYLAVGGEVDCMPFMQQALARRRRVYLPVVHGASLLFAPWDPAGRMLANRFGIPEPEGTHGAWLHARDLDVVLTPLVAFDPEGHRLGMGGGFYDRALAFSRRRTQWRHPRIIGLGYAFQRVATLPAKHWDIGLHGVVTEHGAIGF